jgi:ferredoxin
LGLLGVGNALTRMTEVQTSSLARRCNGCGACMRVATRAAYGRELIFSDAHCWEARA